AAAAQRLAQLGDPHAKRGSARRRLMLSPELVHQPVAGDDPARVEQQERQELALARTRDGQLAPVVGDLQRAEDPEVHAVATLSVTRPLRDRYGAAGGSSP